MRWSAGSSGRVLWFACPFCRAALFAQAMTRLQSQLQRLYPPPAQAAGGDSLVRVMMLALARPADWGLISQLWQGVQAELAWPAPAIAVSGEDAYQLWFSLQEPVPRVQAAAVLDALRQRYLGGVPLDRLCLMTSAEALPPRQTQADQWSAFVAPDLAPMFADTPWLDIEPGAEGQAELLSRLACIKPLDFQRAMGSLGLLGRSADRGSEVAPTNTQAVSTGPRLDPRRFLLDVMNDETVALGLRIDAAKALLPYMPPQEQR